MGNITKEYDSGNSVSKTSSVRRNLLKGFICVILLLVFWNGPNFVDLVRMTCQQHTSVDAVNDWCPLPDVKEPGGDGLKHSDHFNSPDVRVKQVERLAAAVKVPTESFDDNGDVDTDPRWKTFDDFHHILEDLFPLVYV